MIKIIESIKKKFDIDNQQSPINPLEERGIFNKYI